MFYDVFISLCNQKKYKAIWVFKRNRNSAVHYFYVESKKRYTSKRCTTKIAEYAILELGSVIENFWDIGELEGQLSAGDFLG